VFSGEFEALDDCEAEDVIECIVFRCAFYRVQRDFEGCQCLSYVRTLRVMVTPGVVASKPQHDERMQRTVAVD
jgi:hypothetical protein